MIVGTKTKLDDMIDRRIEMMPDILRSLRPLYGFFDENDKEWYALQEAALCSDAMRAR